MDTLTCPFCNPSPEDIVLENDLCYARYDRYPASPGHLLLIPFRHVADFFDATDAEQAALLALVREAKALLDEQFHPAGYNVGVNVGPAAGQTVMHVHLIPRYAGDVEDPRGGVRGVIPEKRVYLIGCTECREESVKEKAVCPAAGEVEQPGFKRRRSSLFGWSRDPRVL
ncbi:HIT family protein [Methanoculleus sp. YWC-01]|jgi:diadenosine tetraphosphate (Ap4A) HIT family hydrolase|uniref:HIT family protein n=1 Tax=Methanoculleus nereidis TaxID=2735141 RepID=A0ABU3Z1Z9_9EURY|nr:HIT family protein [Methanoculleus sp. YWC-01]PKL55268.1 MAG: HIT family protein [Methanomicrobiales archaeon HGW-Methanomicrobiales-6]